MCIRDRCRTVAGALLVAAADVTVLLAVLVLIPLLVHHMAAVGAEQHIQFMSDGYAMTGKDIGLYLTIIRLYEQQQYMYDNRIHSVEPVSYTHLDVYKRQGCGSTGTNE